MTKTIGSLLALAVTTSIALANGGEGDKKKSDNAFQDKGGVTWKPGSGITFGGTDDFTLRLYNQLQVQWAFAANEDLPDSNNFDVRRARTTLAGNVFHKDLHFLLRVDHTDDGAGGNAPVKDAWVQWDFLHNDESLIGVRVGQSKTYHGLEATGSSSGLFFVERSLATMAFSDVRSRGAWLFGSHSENKFRWNAGVQNGDVGSGASGIFEVGDETPNADNELTYVANVSFDPMGDITDGKTNESYKQGNLGDVTETRGTIGAGVMVGNNRDLTNSIDVDSTSININTAWMFNGGLGLQGEYFMRTDSPDTPGGADDDATGFYVQGMYSLAKSGDSPIQWGLGLRVSMVDAETDFATGVMQFFGAGLPEGSITEVTAVVDAFYHGHACKTQFEYTWQDVDADSAAFVDQTNHIFRIQFQVLF